MDMVSVAITLLIAGAIIWVATISIRRFVPLYAILLFCMALLALGLIGQLGKNHDENQWILSGISLFAVGLTVYGISRLKK